MTYALELRNVTKKYPTFTLDHVNLQLPRGCIMGLIGENGAGKSTIIKLLLNLTQPDSGEIVLLGQSADQFSAVRNAALGVVFDECCFPDMFHLQEVESILRLAYPNWDSAAFHRLTARFGLPEKSKIKTYSRGMKMKLSIAAALSHNAKVLILDEATSGLDPVVRDEILDLFLEFIQDEDHTILLASHITSDLEKVCDYITYIHQGHVELSMEKDRLLEEYAVFQGDEKTLQDLPIDAILRVRRHSYGLEALVQRNRVNSAFMLEKPTLERIMLFFSKGTGR